MKTITLQGVASGTSQAIETGAEVLSAYLTNLDFYSDAALTSVITPTAGSVIVEYSSGGQVWHTLTGGQIDLSQVRSIDL